MDKMTIEQALSAARTAIKHRLEPIEIDGVAYYALRCPLSDELSARFKVHRFESQTWREGDQIVQQGFDMDAYLIPVSEVQE